MWELLARYLVLLRAIGEAEETGDWTEVIERADFYSSNHFEKIFIPMMTTVLPNEKTDDFPPEIKAIAKKYLENPDEDLMLFLQPLLYPQKNSLCPR